jgi:hypothetical protein
MDIEVALAELRRVLIQRQLGSGGWPALAWSPQTVTEPTAYAMLALGAGFENEYHRARQCLLRMQNPNGSWPAFIGDDQDGSWATALASIALRDKLEDIPVRLKAFKWLLQSAGKESSWLWKWKFRTADRHVRFDPEKFGWPWQPATNSWVVPTAFAILALNQLPCSCGMKDSELFRIQRGVEMLLDRVCPMGGWNAGNGVVYGTSVAPHPDDTAIALLALKDHPNELAVIKSLEWLEATAPSLQAPWSLAWALLALAAYSRDMEPLLNSLVKLIEPTAIHDIATLAVAALAFDCRHSLTLLGS